MGLSSREERGMIYARGIEFTFNRRPPTDPSVACLNALAFGMRFALVVFELV